MLDASKLSGCSRFPLGRHVVCLVWARGGLEWGLAPKVGMLCLGDRAFFNNV
jgi:hypothetical protein